MTVYDYDLAPLDAPTISIHGSKPDTLHLHLPGDFAFGEGVDIPLNLDGLRLLYDMLERRTYVKRQHQAQPSVRNAALLEAFKTTDMSKVRKVAADPVLQAAEKKRKAREKQLAAIERQREQRAQLEEELGFSIDDLQINL